MQFQAHSVETTQENRRFTILEQVRAKASPSAPISADALKLAEAARSGLFAKGKERGLLFMCIVTLIYLAGEFAFSAWLLEVMAHDSDFETIQRAERLGRIISGFAVALLVWPAILRRFRSKVAIALLLSLATGSVVWSIYHLERTFIATLVSQSTPEQRAAAVSGSLLRQAMVADQISDKMLGGLWLQGSSDTIYGKAFIGVAAYMAAGSNQAIDQTKELAPAVVRGVVESRLGGAAAEYARFANSQALISEQFVEYQKGLIQVAAAQEELDAYARATWHRYVVQLQMRTSSKWGTEQARKRYKGELVPHYARAKVVSEVQKSGVPVPNNWSTGDRATFTKVLTEQKRQDISSAFSAQSKGIPKGLNKASFANTSIVQAQWRESLGYPASVGRLPLGRITEKEFAAGLFPKIVEGIASSQLVSMNTNAIEYGSGQSRAEQGANAYESIVAPVFALVLSLVAALVHVLKSGLLIVHVASGWHFKSVAVKSGVIAVAVASIFLAGGSAVTTEITSHPTYKLWFDSAAPNESNLGSSLINKAIITVVDSSIKLNTIAFPVFDGVRTMIEPILSPLAESDFEATLIKLIQ